MKIYTKRGDSGNTSLYGGKRVSKSAARIKAYGTVDELNSFLGLASSYGLSERGTKLIEKIQKQLFILGADLATPPSSHTRIDRISQDDTDFLEEEIDQLEKELETIRNFILPGGAPTGATLHTARTICRKAERSAVACQESDTISELCIKYLNRLSDFLFVLARYENKEAGEREIQWKPEPNPRR